MKFEQALLEDWMRKYYFEVDFDIGSSGVEDFSMAEIRGLLGIDLEELDDIVFHDSETLGGSTVRQSLANLYTGGDSQRVMVTHGSTEANFLIMTGLLEAGDEVLVLDPFYQQLYAVAAAVGCQLKRWPMRSENGFQPDLADLDHLLTPNTKMVVVNFPHNPTGATLDAAEQQELIGRCREVGAYLVWDGAFTELVYDQPKLPEPVLEYERVISMGTMSKAYGLPGLRVGWCLAAPEVLEKFVLLRDYTLLHLSPLVEFVARKVFENPDKLLAPRREQARQNRAVLDSWISEHRDWIQWTLPRGGVSGFPRFPEELDVEALCHKLALEYRVLLVPGICFRHPSHVRLGFGGSRKNLEGGLERLATMMDRELAKA
ncbi:MAG: capreomycidine synthase [Deltaproteobacteria bacterium]|nr:capreomycidine synthase [Deltaproteobacteria bacterium]